MRLRKSIPVLIATSLVANCGESPTDPDERPQAPPSAAVATILELEPRSLVFHALGDSETLSATVRDQNGAVLGSAAVAWASSDPAMASVEDGRVAAVSNGEVSITATSGSASRSAEVRVEQIAVRVGAAPEEVRLSAIGDTVRLSATAYDANDHEVAAAVVAWSSPDSAVATVSDDGLVTAVANGTAEILATSGEATGTVTVTVEQVAASLVLDVEGVMLTALGDTARITAQAFDSGGMPVENAAVAWSSSDSTVVTVDATGLVTAVRKGDAEITAALEVLKAVVPVSVGQEIASIVVEPDSLQLTFAGDTARISATAFDARGNAIPGAPMSWTSSDTSVVTVDSGGLLTAVSEGDAEVEASADDVGATARVGVRRAIGSLTISPSWLVIVERGDTARLEATARDAGGSEIDAPVTWTSEDPLVATVDSTGLVRSVREGDTRVTASVVDAEGERTIKASATVAYRLIGRLDAEPGAIIFHEVGDTARITATAYDRRSEPIFGAPIGYWSDDPALAVVDETGLVTATGRGNTAIRVASGSKEALVLVGPPIVGTTPPVRFAETPLAEGPAEGGTARFTVILSQPRSDTFTVPYSFHSLDGVTDVEADPSHVVTFPPGDTIAHIEAQVLDDHVPEPTRDTLVVRLDLPPDYLSGPHLADSVLIREGVCDRAEPIANGILAWDQYGFRLSNEPELLFQVDHSKCADMTPESMAEIRLVWGVGLLEEEDRASPTLPAAREEVRPTGDPYLETSDDWLASSSSGPSYDGHDELPELSLTRADLSELSGLLRLSLWAFDLSGSQWHEQLFEGMAVLEDLFLFGNLLGDLPENMFRGINTGSGTCIPDSPRRGRCRITVLNLEGSLASSYHPRLLHDLGGSVRSVNLTSVLGGAGPHELPGGFFARNPGIRGLILDENGLTGIAPDAFRGPSAIVYLSLRDNVLTDLPPGFVAAHPELRELLLENNQIQELPRGFFEGVGPDLRRVAFNENPGFVACERNNFEAPCGWALRPAMRPDFDENEVFFDLEMGAPYTMSFRLYVHGGEVRRKGTGEPVSMVTLPRGRVFSDRFVVSRDPGHAGKVQVQPYWLSPQHAYGLRYKTDDMDALPFFATDFDVTIPRVSKPFPGRMRLLASSALSSSGSDRVDLDLRRYFRPTPGSQLLFDAELVDPADTVSLQIALSGRRLDLTPLNADTVAVRVRATTRLSSQTSEQARDSSAFVEDEFTVAIRGTDADRLNVEVIDVANSFDARVRDAVDWAVGQWGAVLQDVPDRSVDLTGQNDCPDETEAWFEKFQADDLVVLMSLVNEDGPGGNLASAAVCVARAGTMDDPNAVLTGGPPILSLIELDRADADRLSTYRLRRVILHEMAHALGFGIITEGAAWSELAEVNQPFAQPGEPGYVADPHFPGDSARVAFDSAGGTGYAGEKVPVEDEAGPGSAGSHWREAVLEDEVMTPFLGDAVEEPFSAITVRAMQDLGYALQANWETAVESYALPLARSGADMAERADRHEGPVIDLSGDVVRRPIVVIGEDGTIIGVIRPGGVR